MIAKAIWVIGLILVLLGMDIALFTPSPIAENIRNIDFALGSRLEPLTRGPYEDFMVASIAQTKVLTGVVLMVGGILTFASGSILRALSSTNVKSESVLQDAAAKDKGVKA